MLKRLNVTLLVLGFCATSVVVPRTTAASKWKPAPVTKPPASRPGPQIILQWDFSASGMVSPASFQVERASSVYWRNNATRYIRHEDSMCGPHGDTPWLWLGLTWGLHIELACAQPRRLWRLFGAEALLKSSQRRRARGRRHGRWYTSQSLGLRQ